MNPFTLLILICSLSVDQSACRPETARAVIHGPRAPNEIVCGQLGMFTIADTAVRPEPGKEYVKLICTRTGRAQ
jgi:hypothetical protein